jgi:hypothetical protein
VNADEEAQEVAAGMRSAEQVVAVPFDVFSRLVGRHDETCEWCADDVEPDCVAGAWLDRLDTATYRLTGRDVDAWRAAGRGGQPALSVEDKAFLVIFVGGPALAAAAVLIGWHIGWRWFS